jgi:hypothetical protein
MPAVRAEVATRQLTLAAGGAGVVGVLRPIAPAFLLDAGLRLMRMRASAGVLWAPAFARDFPPGSVRASLLSGFARACFASVLGSALRFDLCSGFYAGALHARAEGFTRNASATQPWLAVPVELSLASTPAPAGWELGASALLPLRRQDFSIDNLGVAYESWPVGLLISLRGVGLWAF